MMSYRRYYILVVVFTFLLSMVVVISISSAQTRCVRFNDCDGDGVEDAADRCPNEPGPASNEGCPIPPTITPSSPPSNNAPANNTNPGNNNVVPMNPNDRDGDGTLDVDDACPDQGGPDWNGGCPTNRTAPPVPVVLPVMPETGACVIATRSTDRVFVRSAPSLSAEIIATLDPEQVYPISGEIQVNGETWYQVGPGWSASVVVRSGGNCASIARFETSNININTRAAGNAVITSIQAQTGSPGSFNYTPFPGGGLELNFNFDGNSSSGITLFSIPAGDASSLLDVAGMIYLNPQPEVPGAGSPAFNVDQGMITLNPQPEVPGAGSSLNILGDIGSMIYLNPQPEVPGAGSPAGSPGFNVIPGMITLNPQPEVPSVRDESGLLTGVLGMILLNPQPEVPSVRTEDGLEGTFAVGMILPVTQIPEDSPDFDPQPNPVEVATLFGGGVIQPAIFTFDDGTARLILPSNAIPEELEGFDPIPDPTGEFLVLNFNLNGLTIGISNQAEMESGSP